MGGSTERGRRRREQRSMLRQGIAAYHRVTIDRAAIVKAQESGIDLIDLVMFHVDQALHVLIDQGGDVLRQSVVSIGEHPDFPGDVTIEAKVATLVKPESDGSAL